MAAYLNGQINDDAGSSLATVHYRGGPEEFRAGCELLASTDPRERVVGADTFVNSKSVWRGVSLRPKAITDRQLRTYRLRGHWAASLSVSAPEPSPTRPTPVGGRCNRKP
jgi:hypothetical protein